MTALSPEAAQPFLGDLKRRPDLPGVLEMSTGKMADFFGKPHGKPMGNGGLMGFNQQKWRIFLGLPSGDVKIAIENCH